MKRIKVLLADNEEVFREGLAKILNEQPKIVVVSQVKNGEEAVAGIKESKPDILVLEDQENAENTSKIIEEVIRVSPQIKIAVIGHPERGADVVDVLQAGARAYLAKNISVEDLVKSLDLVSTGRIVISPAFAESFLQDISENKDSDKKISEEKLPLSDRELEIVQLIVKGSTNKEIASQLFIAENTVKVHVKNILDKLDLKNRQQLITHAIMQGWIEIEDNADRQDEQKIDESQ